MGRPPMIVGTEWQEHIERMIADGWASGAISRFVWARFKYAIDDSTIRRYRAEHRDEIKDRYPELSARAAIRVFKEALLDGDEFVDVMGTLRWLIGLQQQRLLIDVTLEEEWKKIMPGTRLEVALLAGLLAQYQQTLQEYGVIPKPGIEVEVNLNGIGREREVIDMPVIEAFPREERAKVIELTRAIHARAKELRAGPVDSQSQ